MPAAAAPPPLTVHDELTPALIAARFLPADFEERGRVLSGINEDDLDAIIAAAQRMKSRSRAKTQSNDDEEGDEPDDEPSKEGAGVSASPGLAPSPPPFARITAVQPGAAQEAGASLGAWLEARFHSNLTLAADELYGYGQVSREEHQALGAAISAALAAFTGAVQDAFPGAYTRGPSAGPEEGGEMAASEATKTEDGKAFPASDYAYVPDAQKPSTWKLRLTSTPGGAPDPRIVGAAAAALGPGFRGQRVQIPAADLPRVKAKVRAAWRRANPDKGDDEMPPGIKEVEEAEVRPLADDEVRIEEATARALAEAGRAEIVVIKPGWGSSGYYPASVLKRDGPQAFKAGTHMYWNHPTATERRERPERDIHELAATLAGDSVYRENGPDGPGLYATAEVMSQWTPHLKELAPHIGTSVFGHGKGHMGVAEGRRGFVFDSLIPSTTNSVDLVTHAGAGGKVLRLIEAARAGVSPGPDADDAPPPISREEDPMPEPQTPPTEDVFAENERQAAEVATLRSEVAALRADQMNRDAAEVARTVLASIGLPLEARNRVAERLVPAGYTTPEGRLDTERFSEAVKEAGMDEMGYLARWRQSMGIQGMGASAAPSETTAEAAEAALERELRYAVPGATDEAIARVARG